MNTANHAAAEGTPIAQEIEALQAEIQRMAVRLRELQARAEQISQGAAMPEGSSND